MHTMYQCPYYVDACIMMVEAMCFLVSLGQSILRASYSGGVQHVRKDSTVTEKINLEQTIYVIFREDLFNRIN